MSSSFFFGALFRWNPLLGARLLDRPSDIVIEGVLKRIHPEGHLAQFGHRNLEYTEDRYWKRSPHAVSEFLFEFHGLLQGDGLQFEVFLLAFGNFRGERFFCLYQELRGGFWPHGAHVAGDLLSRPEIGLRNGRRLAEGNAGSQFEDAVPKPE